MSGSSAVSDDRPADAPAWWRVRSARGVAAVAIVLGLATGGYLFLLTPGQILWLSPDGAAYVGAARNIADGRGPTLPFVPRTTDDTPTREATYDGAAPMYQYSPGLPFVLSVPLIASVPLAYALRALDVLALAATAALLGWGVLRVTRGSWITASLAVFVLISTSVFLVVFEVASSEALFIPLVLGAVALVTGYVVTRRLALAIAFVVIAAFASLTRFTGLAVIGTGVVSIALWWPGSARQRFGRAVVIGGAAMVPFLLWMSHDALGAPGGAGSISYHPPTYSLLDDHLAAFVDGRRGWVFGQAVTWPGWVRTVIALSVVAIVVFAAWRLLRSPDPSAREIPDVDPVHAAGTRVLVGVALTSIVVYLAALFTSMTFFHAAPFSMRYLFPILPVVVAFVAAGLWGIATLPRTHRARIVSCATVAVLALPLLVFHTQSVTETWPEARKARQSLTVAPGSLMEAVRHLPSGDIVFASGPEAAWAMGRHYAIALPATWSIWTKAPNAKRAEEIDEIRRILCRRPGVIALSYYGPNGIAELALRDAGFVIVTRHSNGAIMRSDPARCKSARS